MKRFIYSITILIQSAKRVTNLQKTHRKISDDHFLPIPAIPADGFALIAQLVVDFPAAELPHHYSSVKTCI